MPLRALSERRRTQSTAGTNHNRCEIGRVAIRGLSGSFGRAMKPRAPPAAAWALIEMRLGGSAYGGFRRPVELQAMLRSPVVPRSQLKAMLSFLQPQRGELHAAAVHTTRVGGWQAAPALVPSHNPSAAVAIAG